MSRAVPSWLVVAALAVTVGVGADRFAPLVGLTLAGLCVAHGAALVRARTTMFPVVVGVLGVSLLVTRSSVPPAPLVAVFAAGLLLAVELAYWSSERHTPILASWRSDVGRWLLVGTLVPASVLVALALLVIASATSVDGVLADAAGVGAVVGVVVLALVLLRPAAAER